jgi:biopolymer transport protein TolR
MALGHINFNNNGDDGSGDIADINVIPLVDVLLVLLIIFMVAAPISIGGINIELPVSKARGTISDEDRVVLTVNRDGEFWMDKTRVPAPALNEKLKAIYQFREKKEIFIRADRGVIYSAVIDAMSAAKVAGVTKISMLTQPPGKSG